MGDMDATALTLAFDPFTLARISVIDLAPLRSTSMMSESSFSRLDARPAELPPHGVARLAGTSPLPPARASLVHLGKARMTADPISHVRVLAQSDPVPTIVARWGETVHETRRRVAALEDSLRELDQLRDQLAERQLEVAVDLGPVGNAAAVTRRTVLEHEDRHAGDFTMPRSA